MVIVTGNRHSNQNSNSGKSINPNIFLPAMVK